MEIFIISKSGWLGSNQCLFAPKANRLPLTYTPLFPDIRIWTLSFDTSTSDCKQSFWIAWHHHCLTVTNGVIENWELISSQWEITDSNCGLSACKADTLTTELISLERSIGFEPTTNCLEGSHSTTELTPHLFIMTHPFGFVKPPTRFELATFSLQVRCTAIVLQRHFAHKEQRREQESNLRSFYTQPLSRRCPRPTGLSPIWQSYYM